jgi:small-conductance mechanosensitive channel
MRVRRPLLLIIPTVVLVLCLIGSYLTRGAMANLQFLKSQRARHSNIVDQQPLQTAQALSPLAVSSEEQALAHEVLRVADHEVDQAFAMALRQASTDNRTLTGKALDAAQEVTDLQATVKEDQAAVDTLTASVKTRNPGANDDDLDIAKAQLGLDTDELTDAQNILAIVSGDQRGRIQEELATHDAGMKKYDEQHTDGSQTAVVSAQRHGTLAGRLKSWFDQRSRMSQLEQAAAQADSDAASLTAQYAALQKTMNTLSGKEKEVRAQNDPSASAPPVNRLTLLRRLRAQRSILGILNDRIDGQKELSDAYSKWLTQVDRQHQIVVHLILQSFAWIAFILLGAAITASAVRMVIERRMVNRPLADRRSMHTLLTVLQLVIQLIALILILLVLFGPPSQVPTILGLATAGLTVVFQDFILGFVGWFVLMGKNGIRVGDWVEIEGVGGEVIEIGLFRTALLETGNWTDKGHPTGRRITFVNKYAVTGKYLNFSTSGQWMWDELKLNVPASEDSYAMIERIHQTVLTETAEDTALAQREWERSTQQHGMSHFSATPSVDMQLASSGIDIVVRYVTRASDRFEKRNHLSQAVIKLMQQPAQILQPPTPS